MSTQRKQRIVNFSSLSLFLFGYVCGRHMGWIISGVLAYFLLEDSESKSFRKILPNDIFYFKYIEGILIIFPSKQNITTITHRLTGFDIK